MRDVSVSLRELRALFELRATENFRWARRCLDYAREARRRGDLEGVKKWIWGVAVLRDAAMRWRDRARCIVPSLVAALLLLMGCHHASGTHVNVRARIRLVQNAGTGQVLWSLVMPLDDYHALLEATPEGQERARVRELIRAGLDTNGLGRCAAVESNVARDGADGIAFSGLCRLSTVPVSDHGV